MTEGWQRTLMYLCYGAQAIYDQATYSILSLLHVCGQRPEGFRVVVYCDRAGAFAGLPIEERLIDRATLDGWLAGSDYVHRRKTCAILDALDRLGGAVAFIDTDTYFRRAPGRLFDRIGPGRACLHICEGFVSATGTPTDQALAVQLAAGHYRLGSGTQVVFGPRTRMWNTGVVGVHASDTTRVRDALALADAIWARADPAGAYGKKIHHAEQFAMGYAFRDARLREATDVIYHYWLRGMKDAFDLELPALARSGLADRSEANLARLYRERPRETGLSAWRDSVKMAARGLALAAGVAVPGVRRSV